MLSINHERGLLHWPCDDLLPSSEKRQAQAYERRTQGELSRCCTRAQSSSPLDRPTRRGRRVEAALPSLSGFSKVRWHCSARRPGSKSKNVRRSPIYARFCVSVGQRPHGKQPRPETSIAGTAIPDSGNDKAQRGGLPGRTQKIAHPRVLSRFGGAAAPQQATKTKFQRSQNSNLWTAELSRISQVHSKNRKNQTRKRMLSINHERGLLHWPCDDLLPSSEKRQAQAYERRTQGELSRCCTRAQSSSPLDRPTRRGRRVEAALPSLSGFSKVRWHCSARRPGSKSKNVPAIYARFCVSVGQRPHGKQPRPETSIAGTAIPDSGHGRAQHGQNPGRRQNRA